MIPYPDQTYSHTGRKIFLSVALVGITGVSGLLTWRSLFGDAELELMRAGRYGEVSPPRFAETAKGFTREIIGNPNHVYTLTYSSQNGTRTVYVFAKEPERVLDAIYHAAAHESGLPKTLFHEMHDLGKELQGQDNPKLLDKYQKLETTLDDYVAEEINYFHTLTETLGCPKPQEKVAYLMLTDQIAKDAIVKLQSEYTTTETTGP